MDQRRRDLLMAGLGMGGAAFAAAQATATVAAAPKMLRDMSSLEGFISVKSFGAAGDGASDDTAAIEAAISAMKAGSCLYFPGGTYVISASLPTPETQLGLLLRRGLAEARCNRRRDQLLLGQRP